MKKQLLTLSLILFTILTFAQKKQKNNAKVELPIKDGLVLYQSIIDSLPGQTKDDLYNKSLKWMVNTFEDSKEVIQVKDKEAGLIIGSGLFNYSTPGLLGSKLRMAFLVEITTKNNKSRIKLYQFRSRYLETTFESDYLPIEKGYLEYLAEKQFPRENRNYYKAMSDKIEGILSSYKTFLISNSTDDDF